MKYPNPSLGHRIQPFLHNRAVFLAATGICLFNALPSSEANANKAPRVFRDCTESNGCPEMVPIVASVSEVTIGSPLNEVGRVVNEAETKVKIAAFSLGRFEVTVAEYLTCVAAKACAEPEWRDANSPHNVTSGTGHYYRNLGKSITDPGQPITGVSYVDAISYANWLTKVTGANYRLPSEAEWEYAARAGTVTAYWWGAEGVPSDGKAMAHCRGCGSGFDGRGPAPADSLAPNPWGLFNMPGNVWEWVADTYCDDNTKRPANGSARAEDDCEIKDANRLRTLRGGSTYYGPDKIRSASRLRNFPGFRNFSVGFRVARDGT